MSSLLHDILKAETKTEQSFSFLKESIDESLENLAIDQDEYRIHLLDVVRNQEALNQRLNHAITVVKRGHEEQAFEMDSMGDNQENSAILDREKRILDEMKAKKKTIGQSISLCKEEIDRLQKEYAHDEMKMRQFTRIHRERREALKHEKLMNALFQGIFGLEWGRSGALWQNLVSKQRLFQVQDPEMNQEASMSATLRHVDLTGDPPMTVPIMNYHFCEEYQSDPTKQHLFSSLADKTWSVVAAKFISASPMSPIRYDNRN